jgi:dipeptidyl aminopeptidase/acylaminoacyl peptidase
VSVPIETSELRRRLRTAIEQARSNAAARRARSDAAARDYETFLSRVAIPVVQQFANVLSAEGHHFNVATPAGSVRLTSAAANEDFIETTLDTTEDPPEVVGRTSRGRGRRLISSERAVRERTAVAELNEEDVLAFLLTEIVPFVGR